MRYAVAPMGRGVVLLVMLATAAPAIGSELYDAALRQIRTSVNTQRDGAHLQRLLALRQLHDQTLRPLFERLLAVGDWQIEVHAVLGLAELDEPRRLDPARVIQANPEAQEALVATGIDLDLLGAEQIEVLLRSSDLAGMPRLLLEGERILAGATVDPAGLERLEGAEDERITALAAVLLARLGDATALRTRAGTFDITGDDHPARALWLLEAIRQYHVEAAVPIVHEWLRTPALHADVADWSGFSLLVLDPAAGLAWWRGCVAGGLADRDRVRYGLLLLASGASVPAEAYDELASENTLVRAIMGAGRALADGEDPTPWLITLFEHRHARTTRWAMDRLEDLPDAQAAAGYEHVIDSIGGARWGPDQRVPLAVEATTRLFERRPEAVVRRLEEVEDDGLAQEVLLRGLWNSHSPAAADAAGRVRRAGASRADSLALLIVARYAPALDEQELHRLGMIAAGGGRVAEALRVQGAWLYLRHAGLADRALAELFAAPSPP